ncbi:MAG: CHASE4 domain-containing protein, partial [Candidatus Bipolaricaulia bacterium]
MRLRTQVVLGILGVAAIFLGLLFGLASPYLRSRFLEIERIEVSRNLDSALNAVGSELSAMESSAHDWAAWTDTLRFVQGTNPEFVEENLMSDTFTNLRLNLMAFYDASGRLVYAKAFDLEQGAATSVGADTLDAATSVVPAPLSPADTVSRTGLLSIGGSLALVAVHPILASSHEPPTGGTLVLLRGLGAAEIERLSGQVVLPLVFRAMNDPRNDPSVLATLSGGDPEQTPTAVVPESETTVLGYTLLRDVDGQPVALLEIEMPRATYTAGMRALRYMVIGLLAAFAVLAAGFLFFIDQRVLARTGRLTNRVAEIAAEGDAAARVAVEGKDELARLAGNINGMLASIEEARTALERSERRYHNLFDSSRDPIYITTEDGRFVDANPAVVELFGYTRDELLAMTAGELYARPEDRDAFRAAIAEKGFVANYPLTLRRKDGAVVQCLLTTITDQLAETKEPVYQGIIRDVTELLRQQEELTFLASHDPLTGLLNRGALNDVLTLEIARAMRNLERVAVFYLDLDKFKEVNDVHGHAAGDRVLQDVAARLRETLRASDTVARLGGDEFVALLPGIDSPR